MIGWIVASLSASGWRFMWIRPRRAITHTSCSRPRDGCGSRSSGVDRVGGGHARRRSVVRSVVAVIERPPRYELRSVVVVAVDRRRR